MTKKDDLIRAAGKLLVVENDCDPKSIREYNVDGERTDIWVCSNDRYKDQLIMKDIVWPVEARDSLIVILLKRQKLKAELDKSMGMYYELNNMIARGEQLL